MREKRPDLIDRATKSLLADDAAAHAQLWEAMAGLDAAARPSAIACPTLILAGEADPSFPPPAARLLRAKIAGSRLAVQPGVSHMITLESAGAVNARLGSFLAQFAAEQDHWMFDCAATRPPRLGIRRDASGASDSMSYD